MSDVPTVDLELIIAPLGDGLGLTMRLMELDIRRGPFPLALDLEMLRALDLDAAHYGATLRDALFAVPEALSSFRECRAVALGARQRLRIHLILPTEFQILRWERLLDPYSGRALAVDGDLLLSRYLTADDYVAVRLRPRGELRALIAIAAPNDYNDYSLASIDVAAEAAPAKAAMADFQPISISATWEALSDSLRMGYDIVYLVAHGVFEREKPWLYLVDEDGNADRRSGRSLVDLVRSLGERRPRLVVLASCESAGDGYADAVAALGPLLAQAGVPAVLAMQGKLSIATNERFAPVLFHELMVDGAIDRAVNAARLAVAEDQPDWWVPVLYTRMHGILWEGEGLNKLDEDITLINAYSQRNIQLIAHHSRLQVGEEGVVIRRDCLGTLFQMTDVGSVLVVGDPGSGKSGVLYAFAEESRLAHRDVVFLSVDKLGVQSLSELQREIRINGDLVEVLENWVGRQPGFLVIDALDAARSDLTVQVFRDLIRLILSGTSRWRVIASIRKFDLRHSSELQQLFRGEAPGKHNDLAFPRVRHISVSHLSTGELSQLASQSARLYKFLENSTPELQKLLKVPFNLYLMASLLSNDGTDVILHSIHTANELLERYWTERVIGERKDADNREIVLRTACEVMVSNRSLRASRHLVAKSNSGNALSSLLSDQILAEWQLASLAQPDRYSLTFTHHVLFDYAIARLLLRQNPEQIIDEYIRNPGVLLFIQPSLVQHYAYLWALDSDRQQFWSLTFLLIQNEHVSETAKSIGLTVVSELTTSLSDLVPLLEALGSLNVPTRIVAEHAYRHLTSALLSASEGLFGQNEECWSEMLLRATQPVKLTLSYAILALLGKFTDRPSKLTTSQNVRTNEAARNLLEFAWAQNSYDARLVDATLRAVCRTFGGNPLASANLISRCLERSHIERYGFNEMPCLGREIEWIIPHAPNLVTNIYASTFGFEESSSEPTPLGRSQIVSLISNRRQDYQLAKYSLAEHLPAFFELAPLEATRATILVMEGYVAQERGRGIIRTKEETFAIGSREAKFLRDGSHMWDHSEQPHEDAIKIMISFREYLEHLCREGSVVSISEMLEVVYQENRLAAIWNILLEVGAKYPLILGRKVVSLAWTPVFLISLDTTTNAGAFIQSNYSLLQDHEKLLIEEAILAVPSALPQDNVDRNNRSRNRLLACIPEIPISAQAKALFLELKRQDALPVNDPPYRIGPWMRGGADDEEHLQYLGVPVDEAANKHVIKLLTPIKEFVGKFLNDTPDPATVDTILPSLNDVYDILQQTAPGVHMELQKKAWLHIAEACERITRMQNFSEAISSGVLIKTILVQASLHPDPTPQQEDLTSFDSFTSWSPAPRISAAQGIPRFARNKDLVDADLLGVLSRLIVDPVPVVRFHVVRQLITLYSVNSDVFWSLVETRCHEEHSSTVLHSMINDTLWNLAVSERERVFKIVSGVLQRLHAVVGRNSARSACVALAANVYIWRGFQEWYEILGTYLNHIMLFESEARSVVFSLRQAVTYGEVSSTDSPHKQIRTRAISLYRFILEVTDNSINQLEREHQNIPFEQWTQDKQEHAKALLQLRSSLGMEVYFASGTYSIKQTRHSDDEQPMSDEVRRRFYTEAGELLDEIAVSSDTRTTHHLLEILEASIPFDPEGVFQRISNVIRAGKANGYQFESLGIALVVRLVERYLADYRTLLQASPDNQHRLVEILDTFLQVGWPDARRLVYRLSEIFR